MKSELMKRESGEAIEVREGLRDPEMRAFVRVMGILQQLDSDRARRRVVGFVTDYFAEQAELDETR